MTGRGRLPQRLGNTASNLPARLRERGPALFNQQCWLWGCDIRRDAGNLLLEYGFARTRPPEGVKGSNRYHLLLHEERHVELWAWGSWLGDATRGGLLLNRYTCVPSLAMRALLPDDVWLPADVRGVEAPQTGAQWRLALGLLADLLDWISAYEQWVLAAAGLVYREACVAAWERGPCRIPPLQALDDWRMLAVACRVGVSAEAVEEHGRNDG